ncbi:MAG: gloB [Verrucomicrobiaceae bacterium]|nr:gloB [Verrucomicrobiaceae bacterium]
MLSIEPIAAFKDNYIWCLHKGSEAWIVDPGDADPVEAFLAEHNLTLNGILITHHHHDHTGGVVELARRHSLKTVYGPRNPSIAGITDHLSEGDSIRVFGQEFSVLEIPGHTLDHIAYFSADAGSTGGLPPTLFCGDTLFAAGCGRLFEGSAEQMYRSLQKLANLPSTTAVYCAHEYTEANLRFALAVEPANLATQQRAARTATLREMLKPTLPSTLQIELETNPFLRVDATAVKDAVQKADPNSTENVQIFAALRSWKDHF